MARTFDPYRTWLGIPPEEQPPNYYRLLGIGLFESEPDVISNAADRQMAHVRTFQTGKLSAISQRILNELSFARVTLLDPERRAVYDEQLRQALATAAPPPVPAEAPPVVLANGGAEVLAPPEILPFPGTVQTVRRPGRRTLARKRSQLAPLVTLILLGVIVVAAVVLAAVLSGQKRSGREKPLGQHDRRGQATYPCLGGKPLPAGPSIAFGGWPASVASGIRGSYRSYWTYPTACHPLPATENRPRDTQALVAW